MSADERKPFDLSEWLCQMRLAPAEHLVEGLLALQQIEKDGAYIRGGGPLLVVYAGAYSGEALWTMHGLFWLGPAGQWYWAREPIEPVEIVRRWPRYLPYCLDRIGREIAHEEDELESARTESDRAHHEHLLVKLHDQLLAVAELERLDATLPGR